MTEIPENIDLANPEFLQAWKLLRHSRRSVFLTGKAGTGKSTFLRYICSHIRKNHVVLAPTGIAAVNVGGMTLHSFFQIPFRPVPPDDPDYTLGKISRKLKFNKDKIKLIKALDLIIIDEISMVRPDVIDFIDRALRAVTGMKRLPFGGKQLLLVGDIFQLSPVVTADSRDILSRCYSDFFFFNAKVYQEFEPVSIELKKVYRQTDNDFVSLLDRVRMCSATHEDMRRLNSRVVDNPPEYAADHGGNSDFTVTLASRRDLADAYNLRMMARNPNDEIVFEGMVEGDFPDKLLPTDLRLSLKKDAQVMIIKNDKERRWVNGTLAKVADISDDHVRITLENGETHTMTPEIWENVKYTFDTKENKVNEEIIGRFTQYPLKAAWALTVHKSQGLTFNKVAIEMGGGAFSAGQTYVALSRCRSLEGLSLLTPLSPRDVIVSRGALDFSRRFNDNALVDEALNEARADILYEECGDSFDDGDMQTAVDKFAEAVSLRNELARPGVRRLVARKLSRINYLEERLRCMQATLNGLAEEYVAMGAECLAEGHAAAALANYEKAFRLNPSNADASLGRARSLAAKGSDEAAELLASELSQSGIKSIAAGAWLLKGEIAIRQGRAEDALMSLTNSLKADRKNADTHDLIADAYDALGFSELADKHRDKAAKLRRK